MPFIQRLSLQGMLSFPSDMEPFDLQPLNVLIGPNGAGKTNVIEALEILRSTPSSVGQTFQSGGGVEEWIWKGNPDTIARISVVVEGGLMIRGPIRYLLEYDEFLGIFYVKDERIDVLKSDDGKDTTVSLYRYNSGSPVISARIPKSHNQREERKIDRGSIDNRESVLSQIKEPSLYPELSWISGQFGKIFAFREWVFGAHTDLRLPQRVDDPSDILLSSARNLALVIHEIHHQDHRAFDAAMKRFLPRYERMTTRIHGGTVQLFLHESGLRDPIPSTRISDGTLRFLAMLAVLLSSKPPPLLCLEEPELGLHPDAVALLAELLVKASSRMQLVVTTHSDALLSALGNQVESVLVCENDGHGTTIQRLDAERLAHWLKDYTLGDIWRIGEIGGNP